MMATGRVVFLSSKCCKTLSPLSIRSYCQKIEIATVEQEQKKKVTLKTKDRSGTLPKIYTKTGDNGKSSLFTGERRSKNDEIFEALGTVDELSSNIGLAMAASSSKMSYLEQLERIQCILQDVGALIATPSSTARKAHTERVVFNSRHTSELEEWIDEYTKELPPLENFILPGGSLTSASLHVARTICRRAERRVVPLIDKDEVDREALKYLNRLSDFLFTLARYTAKIDKKEETIYIRPDTRTTLYKPVTAGVWKKAKE